jgi:hypothetical protein
MRALWGVVAGVAAAAGVWAASSSSVWAQSPTQMPHPGQAIYRLRCAT